MKKKAIIFDLDNTIYSVQTIGPELFATLFELIENKYSDKSKIAAIKKDIMRKPFQVVAAEYGFTESLVKEGMELLTDIEYRGKMEPYEDYILTRGFQTEKFLVTTGFFKLQQSKIDQLGIRNDFRQIYIVDPAKSSQTKKEVFAEIMITYNYMPSELLVLGDDLQSEIKAALELGIDAVLYNKEMPENKSIHIPVISHFGALVFE